jgi:hypothetical protein
MKKNIFLNASDEDDKNDVRKARIIGRLESLGDEAKGESLRKS